MTVGGDIFGIIVMLVAAGVGIAFLDFILRNLPDALDDSPREFTDSDSRTATLRNTLNEKPPAGNLKRAGARGGSAEGSVTNGSQTIQINNSLQTRTSTSLRNSDLIASQDGQ